ncbi:MAG: hypothetical protein P8M03_01010 [Flavobacteriaceae bacterium]|nr:hypothetical protein [Flavobacteriaceae bacterium]
MEKIINYLKVYWWVIVSLGVGAAAGHFTYESEVPATRDIPRDIPRDIYISGRLDEPRKAILRELRANDYSPLGYRLYTTNTLRDEFGNETQKKEYRSKLIIVSEGYYNEIRKFNLLTDIYINPNSALQKLKAPGTEKGYKLYLELLKCEDNKDYPYMFAMSGNEKCFVNIPTDY